MQALEHTGTIGQSIHLAHDIEVTDWGSFVRQLALESMELLEFLRTFDESFKR